MIQEYRIMFAPEKHLKLSQILKCLEGSCTEAVMHIQCYWWCTFYPEQSQAINLKEDLGEKNNPKWWCALATPSF